MALLPAEYWREKAEEVRTKAEGMNDVDAKATMLDIASKYERLAQRAVVLGDLASSLKKSD